MGKVFWWQYTPICQFTSPSQSSFIHLNESSSREFKCLGLVENLFERLQYVLMVNCVTLYQEVFLIFVHPTDINKGTKF